jgi:hypothetical protein
VPTKKPPTVLTHPTRAANPSELMVRAIHPVVAPSRPPLTRAEQIDWISRQPARLACRLSGLRCRLGNLF